MNIRLISLCGVVLAATSGMMNAAPSKNAAAPQENFDISLHARVEFNVTDTNMDGRVSDEETLVVLDKQRRVSERIRARYDLNKDGEVADAELALARQQRQETVERAQMLATSSFDVDKNGELNDAERAAWRKSTSEAMLLAFEERRQKKQVTPKPYSEFRQALAPLMDANGDGKISVDENKAVDALVERYARHRIEREDATVALWLQLYDVNKDGSLDGAEMSAMLKAEETKFRVHTQVQRKLSAADRALLPRLTSDN